MMKFRQGAKRLIPILVATGGLWVAVAPGAAAATGAQNPGATITGADASTPIPPGVSQSSNQVFNTTLPPLAACSQDSATGNYAIDSYAVDNNLVSDPGTMTFPGGTPSQGTVLLQNNTGNPYSGEQTAPTTGEIPQTPPFNWNNFAGAFGSDASSGQPLYPGTFNIGIMCATPQSQPDKWWNAQVTFAASRTDPNGFTWEVTPAPATPETPFAIALPVSAVGVAGISLLVLRRRRRRVPAPSGT